MWDNVWISSEDDKKFFHNWFSSIDPNELNKNSKNRVS